MTAAARARDPQQGTPPAAVSDPAQAPTAAHTDDDLLQEFALLTIRNRRLDEEKLKNNQRLAAIHERCLSIFEERKMRATDLVGIGNLHLKRDTWAKVIRDDGDYDRKPTEDEKARAARALKRAGLGHLITPNFNMNTVSAQFREWDKAGEPPPPQLAKAFHFDRSKFKLNLTT